MARANAAFSVAETHGRAMRPGNRLVAHSESFRWQHLYAARFVEAPFETTEIAVEHPSFIYHLTRPTDVTRRIAGGTRERALIVPRRITLTPGTTIARWQHSGRPEILQVYVRQSLIDSIAEEMYDCDASSVHLRPRFAMQDPLLEELAITIDGLLRDGTGESRIFAETVAQMVAAQLVRAHSSSTRAPRRSAPDGLADWRLQRLADLIEENLDGDLSLDAMAAEVGLSSLYLIRAFKHAFGEPPHRYVVRRRIERAKDLLRTTDMPVAQVAFAVGFSSQSHLSDWFQRVVGVSPALYRRQCVRGTRRPASL
jgi:AraC family transcriptional regulator